MEEQLQLDNLKEKGTIRLSCLFKISSRTILAAQASMYASSSSASFTQACRKIEPWNILIAHQKNIMSFFKIQSFSLKSVHMEKEHSVV